MPNVPKIERNRINFQFLLQAAIFVCVFNKSDNEKNIATIFLKNAFCKVGISPDIFTKRFISAKQKAAHIIHNIPLFFSFILTPLI